MFKKRNAVILKANRPMRNEDIKKEEEYYSNKLRKKCIIIGNDYDVLAIPPIKSK